MTQANDDLKAAVEAMYRMALEGCQTREECMRVRADVHALARRLFDFGDDDCFDRANAIDRSKKESERT